MKKLLTIALSLLSMLCLSYTAVAGSLDSPGAPSAGSGMYTLQNLYDYLTSGTALTVQTGFQEPTSGPTAGTMKTTKQIGDDVKSMFDLCAITAASDVKSGMPFFCTQPGIWGVQTGTLPLTPTPTPTSTLTMTPTSTPTLTPTPWGQTACEQVYGGHWMQTQLAELDNYGCWFACTENISCKTRCESANLTVDRRDWNDDASCTVGLHVFPPFIISGCRGYSASCYGHHPARDPNWEWVRKPGCSKDWDNAYSANEPQLCVCKP